MQFLPNFSEKQESPSNQNTNAGVEDSIFEINDNTASYLTNAHQYLWLNLKCSQGNLIIDLIWSFMVQSGLLR